MDTIKDIVNLCIENDVDFEVWHGEDPKHVERAAMLVNLNPVIRIDFGDKKHGQRISRLHLAGNHKITVKKNQLIEAIKAHKIENKWNNGVVDIPTDFQWDSHSGTQGTIAARITGPVVTVDNGDGTWTTTVEAESERKYYLPRTLELVTVQKTPLILRSIHTSEYQVQSAQEHLVPDYWVTAIGQFTYPNIIEVESMGARDIYV